MNRFVLSEQAQTDFLQAFEFVASYSTRAVLKWEARMLDALRHLGQWPKTGKLRAEFGPPPHRFWIVEDYILIYNPETNPVTIVAILHGAQELSALITARLTDPESDE